MARFDNFPFDFPFTARQAHEVNQVPGAVMISGVFFLLFSVSLQTENPSMLLRLASYFLAVLGFYNFMEGLCVFLEEAVQRRRAQDNGMLDRVNYPIP